MSFSIPKPYVLKLEMTRGCNLSCDFCPISTEEPQRNFASLDLIREVVEQYRTFKPKTRIELAQRGEPTLNPNILTAVSVMRKELPEAKIVLFTNGVKFFKEPELIDRLLSAGVNQLCIDCYNNTYERFKAIAQAHTDALVIDFKDTHVYRYDNPWGLREVVLVDDVANQSIQVRGWHNFAGAATEVLKKNYGHSPTLPLDRGCARPFREFTIFYDGTVPFCCHDWNAKDVFWKFPEMSLEELWNDERRVKMLQRVYMKDRNFDPCLTCDYHGGYRLGLLPSPFLAEVAN